MANTLITKNSSTGSNVPAAGELVEGELAINTADKKLYSKTASAVFQVFDGVYATEAHTHNTYDRASSVLSGATVFSNIIVTDGIVQASIATREFGAADLATGSLATGVNSYFTASSNSNSYKIPFMNYTGTASTNAGMLHDSTASLTYNPSTNTFFAGAVTGTTIGGITQANLVDKAAAEVVTGAWSVPSLILAKTASYTMILGDAGKTVRFTGATASKVCTIPANASVAYPIGTMIGVTNDGSVTMTIAITTDTLTWGKDNTTGTRTLAAGADCVIHKTTATTWKINGSALVT